MSPQGILKPSQGEALKCQWISAKGTQDHMTTVSQLRQNNLCRWWCPPRAFFSTQTCTHKAELPLRQQLPKQTESSQAQQAKAVSLSNFAPRPRTELLQLPWCFRGAVDMQGYTEPGRIRAWLPEQTHTHFSRAPRSCNSAQLVQQKAKQEKNLPVKTALSRAASALLLYCRWWSQGLPTARTHPQASHKINRVSGVWLHIPHPCTRPPSLEVKKAC